MAEVKDTSMTEKLSKVAEHAAQSVAVQFAAVLPDEMAESLEVSVAGEKVAEGFVFMLHGAKFSGYVVKTSSVPASWWQHTKYVLTSWLPEFIAKRITVEVIEIPTVLHIKGR